MPRPLPETPQDEFFTAARDGDLERVKRGPFTLDPEWKEFTLKHSFEDYWNECNICKDEPFGNICKNGTTALIEATRGGQRHIVEWLLARNVDANGVVSARIMDDNGMNAVHHAVQSVSSNSEAILKALLAADKDQMARRADQDQMGCSMNNRDIAVKSWRDPAAPVSCQQDFHGNTPLHLSLMAGRMMHARMLIESGTVICVVSEAQKRPADLLGDDDDILKLIKEEMDAKANKLFRAVQRKMRGRNNTESYSCYHEGELEVSEHFWDDHDQDIHGQIDTPEMRSQFPEGFQWS